jgi:1,4-dihydroxy-2-naphthoyl-CoA hydrolase
MSFRTIPTLSQLNERSIDTLSHHLGIEFTEIGDDYLKARMPVDKRTVQPMGRLHGGASVVLAETLGSVAGLLCVESHQSIVGLDINANHLKSAADGWVTGIVRPYHIGRTTQVWNIEIHNDANELICISRLTIAVIEKK